jgi:8-oxo-dGTP pyrophosphatase MutT (NUDIX family)
MGILKVIQRTNFYLKKNLKKCIFNSFYKMCLHKTCKKFNENRKVKGVGALLVLRRYRSNGINITNAVLLGRERFGNYAGKYNLCGGKMDASDNGCVISAIIREIYEEFKIDLSGNNPGLFDSIFRGDNGFIRCFFMGNTLMFVGFLPSGFSRKRIKPRMIRDCKNHPDSSFREMDDVKYFDSNTQRQIENRNCTVSSYASSAIQKAQNYGLI